MISIINIIGKITIHTTNNNPVNRVYFKLGSSLNIFIINCNLFDINKRITDENKYQKTKLKIRAILFVVSINFSLQI